MQPKWIVVGLGEILWDVFPDGARFGGAPANVACHAAQLGADARMASAVGRDELGAKALAALGEKGVGIDCVLETDYPTGVVRVELDAAGKATYEFASDTAWDHLEWLPPLAMLAAQTEAACFGTLGQRSELSRQTIRRFVQMAPETALKVFDINLRPPFYTADVIWESLKIANVLKLNEDELPLLAKLCQLAGDGEVELLRQLALKFDLKVVALTRGDRGAVLCRGGETSEFKGRPVQVVDTVGAGDAFTAALLMGLFEDWELDAINERACRIAAYVCTQPGATPRIPQDLIELG